MNAYETIAQQLVDNVLDRHTMIDTMEEDLVGCPLYEGLTEDEMNEIMNKAVILLKEQGL